MHIFQFVCTQYMCLFCVAQIFRSFFGLCLVKRIFDWLACDALLWLNSSYFSLSEMWWQVFITTQQKYRTQNLFRIKWKSMHLEVKRLHSRKLIKIVEPRVFKIRIERPRTAYDSIFYTCMNMSLCDCVRVCESANE